MLALLVHTRMRLNIDSTLSPYSDEEVKAIQILSSAIRSNPSSYTLLHVQCDFLRSKGKHEWALQLAKQAVNCAPSEFVTWEKLTEIWMELGEWESVSAYLMIS
jgi:Chs5-Arf1p-binding protein BUD7/BCH1